MPEPLEMRVWSLGQKDPLVEEIATQSGMLAGIISQTEELGRLQPLEWRRVRHS